MHNAFWILVYGNKIEAKVTKKFLIFSFCNLIIYFQVFEERKLINEAYGQDENNQK